MRRISRALTVAALVVAFCIPPARAQVPPTGSGTNGWLNAIYNVLGGTTAAGPRTTIQGNAAGTTGAVVGTLAGTAGKTTFICGFNVGSIGGTAATGPITIAGLNGGSQIYQLTSTATGVNVAQTFSPCLPATGANTAITITTTANGTASAVNVSSWGYQQ